MIRALAGILFMAAAGAASAQGTLKSKYGDWQHRCDKPAANGAEQCILIQNVLDQSELNLAVVVLKVEDQQATSEARKKDPKAAAVRRPVLRVIAPLGILLPRGLGLKIDDREIGSTGFVRCLESGCVAEVDMDNALLDTFRKGKTALFAIFLTPEEGRGLPVTLAGFEQGFAQLQ
ncbi:MAG: invasion associated locus B family protein [Proteobacteria bacterium]|nr:invasion associated locus B family protein [Pseudomonadota bacterium]